MESKRLTELRETALKMSRDLHPDNYGMNQAQAYGQYNNKVPPPLDVLLKDADRIYAWLINPAIKTTEG